MRSRSFHCFTVCLLALCGGVSISAQHRGYHMQLSNGTSGWVAIINDSQRPIEAFHFAGQCGNGAESFTYDALDGPGSVMSHPPVDGHDLSQSVIVKPGERMYSHVNLLPQPSGCVWQGDIDAVIFADGTYEGDETTARNMQAHRDGIAAALRYWAGQFRQPAGDIPDLAAIVLKAEALSDADFKKTMFPECRKNPLACEYWTGRRQVDSLIKLWGGNTIGDTQRRYAGVLRFRERWQTKVDKDTALIELDETFPLPADLASTR